MKDVIIVFQTQCLTMIKMHFPMVTHGGYMDGLFRGSPQILRAHQLLKMFITVFRGITQKQVAEQWMSITETIFLKLVILVVSANLELPLMSLEM